MTLAKNQPLSSYGPELLALLVKGGRERVELTMSHSKAEHLRARCSQLRKQLGRENHPMYGIASRARISIVWGKKAGFLADVEERIYPKYRCPMDRSVRVKLILEPRDSEFTSFIAQAGISPDELKSDIYADLQQPIVDNPAPGVTTSSFIDSLLKDQKP